MNTTDVDNFPGFPQGVMGPELMTNMQKQAERFGTKIIYDDLVEADFLGLDKRLLLGNGDELISKTVIFATGSSYRKLGVTGEERLSGYGVSWCATCDGAFFKQKHVAVVGGGDSAMEEATFLTRFADKVYVIHRSSHLRASAAMRKKAEENKKIEFIFNSVVDEIVGEESVTGINLSIAGDTGNSLLEVSGVFVAIGSDPRTHLVHGQLELTKHGTVKVDYPSSKTNLEGVFAAGDVVDSTYRQAITAAGTGCVAALDAQHYLESLTSASLLSAKHA
jgi:thioredoxin reductase (NADPH)